jgi:hypothetical protein
VGRNVPRELVATEPDAFNPLPRCRQVKARRPGWTPIDSWFQYESRLVSFRWTQKCFL